MSQDQYPIDDRRADYLAGVPTEAIDVTAVQQAVVAQEQLAQAGESAAYHDQRYRPPMVDQGTRMYEPGAVPTHHLEAGTFRESPTVTKLGRFGLYASGAAIGVGVILGGGYALYQGAMGGSPEAGSDDRATSASATPSSEQTQPSIITTLPERTRGAHEPAGPARRDTGRSADVAPVTIAPKNEDASTPVATTTKKAEAQESAAEQDETPTKATPDNSKNADTKGDSSDNSDSGNGNVNAIPKPDGSAGGADADNGNGETDNTGNTANGSDNLPAQDGSGQ